MAIMQEVSAFNNEPRIRLIDSNDQLIEMVSQIEASRMLRNGICKLLLVKPPTVRFIMNADKWEPLFKTANIPHWWKKTENWRFARRTELYGNYHVLYPDSSFTMFHTSATKVLWYLNRDAVDIVCDNPPTVRFTFVPAGKGNHGDKYYISTKENICVCCGSQDDLSRHHVVPRVFRKNMPDHIKNNSHHDVLLLCVPCHHSYEIEACKFKKQICSEYGIIVDDNAGQTYLPEIGKSTRAARAIINHGDKIPEERKSLLMATIVNALGGRTPSQQDLEYLASQNPWRISFDDNETYGRLIARKVVSSSEVQAFSERWRQHFVESMQPKFLPEYWDVRKPIMRNSV